MFAAATSVRHSSRSLSYCAIVSDCPAFVTASRSIVNVSFAPGSATGDDESSTVISAAASGD
ncbi:MAG TPA: hypothetical protein VF608_04765 [Thermoanaerobaculia bacterium]